MSAYVESCCGWLRTSRSGQCAPSRFDGAAPARPRAALMAESCAAATAAAAGRRRRSAATAAWVGGSARSLAVHEEALDELALAHRRVAEQYDLDAVAGDRGRRRSRVRGRRRCFGHLAAGTSGSAGTTYERYCVGVGRRGSDKTGGYERQSRPYLYLQLTGLFLSFLARRILNTPLI